MTIKTLTDSETTEILIGMLRECDEDERHIVGTEALTTCTIGSILVIAKEWSEGAEQCLDTLAGRLKVKNSLSWHDMVCNFCCTVSGLDAWKRQETMVRYCFDDHIMTMLRSHSHMLTGDDGQMIDVSAMCQVVLDAGRPESIVEIATMPFADVPACQRALLESRRARSKDFLDFAERVPGADKMVLLSRVGGRPRG